MRLKLSYLGALSPKLVNLLIIVPVLSPLPARPLPVGKQKTTRLL